MEDEHARSDAAEEQLRQMKRIISDRQILSQVRLIPDLLNWILRRMIVLSISFQILKMNLFYVDCLYKLYLVLLQNVLLLIVFLLVLDPGKRRNKRTQEKVRRTFTNV